MASGSSPLDSQTDQSGFQLSNHLPTNPITSTNTIDRSRIKCANHRCGTGSKVRSVSFKFIIIVNNDEKIYYHYLIKNRKFVLFTICPKCFNNNNNKTE